MEDKVFDLLEKMYLEIQDVKANMATKQELEDVKVNMATKQELEDVKANMATKQELEDVKANMATKQELEDVKVNMATKQELEDVKVNMATKQELQGIKQDIIRIENKMDQNHKALYDGYRQSIEGIHELKENVQHLTDKVDNQEIKLQVLKSVK